MVTNSAIVLAYWIQIEFSDLQSHSVEVNAKNKHKMYVKLNFMFRRRWIDVNVLQSEIEFHSIEITISHVDYMNNGKRILFGDVYDRYFSIHFIFHIDVPYWHMNVFFLVNFSLSICRCSFANEFNSDDDSNK